MNPLLKQISIGRDIAIELLRHNEQFLGLGSIRLGDCILRSGRCPMFVEIRNPSGIQLVDYILADCVETAEETRLHFKAKRQEGGLMEWMVHEVRSRYNTADWSESPQPAEDTTLELVLRPVSREIGGRKYSGFSYQYHYRSDSIPIYKLLDRGTWEIGGTALANEFWMRSCFVPSILKVASADQFYSTEWYIPSCANPNAFQFLPLQTELQGFTFTAAKSGVLMTWASEVAHVRSLFEKPRGKNLLMHFHEHCGDLSHHFATAPMEVLWCAGERNRVELANDFEAMHEYVRETLHAQIGMRRDRVAPYGHMEEWGPADLERYRTIGLPKLQDVGMKTIFLANHFENNMNTWGVSNMCCSVDYKVAESVGEDKLQALCQKAREDGMVVEMWANTSISSLTPIFHNRNGSSDRIKFLPKKDSIMEAINPETAFVRNPSNAIDADHYTPVFAVLNLRDESVRKYWLRQWKHAHDEIGLGGIFLDSSFNLSCDKFHYVQNTEAGIAGATVDQTHLLGNLRPQHEPPQAILSQYHAHLGLMVEMQKLGYVYCNEDLGVFGINRQGPSLSMRLENLFLWGNCLADFDPIALKQAGRNIDDVFFQGLAYRMIWSVHWNIAQDILSYSSAGLRVPEDAPSAWHRTLFHVFNRVEPLMQNRTILPDEAGVIYRFEDKQVLWAFSDLLLPLEATASISDVLGEETFETHKLEARKNHIYILSLR